MNKWPVRPKEREKKNCAKEAQINGSWADACPSLAVDDHNIHPDVAHVRQKIEGKWKANKMPKFSRLEMLQQF